MSLRLPSSSNRFLSKFLLNNEKLTADFDRLAENKSFEKGAIVVLSAVDLLQEESERE